jgi:hypothetical protein
MAVWGHDAGSVKAEVPEGRDRLSYPRRSPAAPDFAISRTTCITVRHAIVMLPWRDMASAMCRVITGSTSFDDCRWQSFDAAAIA